MIFSICYLFQKGKSSCHWDSLYLFIFFLWSDHNSFILQPLFENILLGTLSLCFEESLLVFIFGFQKLGFVLLQQKEGLSTFHFHMKKEVLFCFSSQIVCREDSKDRDIKIHYRCFQIFWIRKERDQLDFQICSWNLGHWCEDFRV